MSKKLKEILSELATDIKAYNIDDRVSFRYLHSKFKDKIAYFLRIDAKSRELISDLTLWKTIVCVDLEDANVSSCGYTDYCNSIKRSVNEIPEAYNTNYGQLIKVFTLDGKREFTFIKSVDYADHINREYGNVSDVFWLENKHIFIPNVDIEAVKVLIIPKDSSEVDQLNNNPQCNLVLNTEINYPDYLISLAKQEVLKEIAGVYKRVIEDEKGDENNNNKS